MRTAFFFLLAAAHLGCAAQADEDGFIRQSGTLESGDETLRSGEFVDRYTIRAEPGQWIEAAMTSSALDPYLILQPPDCDPSLTDQGACDDQADNDDLDSRDSQAFLWHRADQSGNWSLIATSSTVGEAGAYEVAYRVAEAGERPATSAIEEVGAGGSRRESGTLASGDNTLQSGEFVDYYSFFGREGAPLTVDLRSSAFDPYLILLLPNDEQLDNDDHEGDQARSVIETTLPADGLYRIGVTTYAPGESGAYELAVQGAANAVTGGAESADPFVKD